MLGSCTGAGPLDDALAGDSVAVRRAEFEPDLASVGRARALLREVLSDSERGEWLDTAVLAASELVTNAVLHARTRLELSVEVHAGQLLVEVRDASTVLPEQRHYDSEATTGRGLSLVAALTSSYGVRSLGADGKVVWFTVDGSVPEQSEDDLLAAWDDAEWDLRDVETAVETNLVPLRLLGMPPTLWMAARQHHDALMRELVLYAAEHAVDVDFAMADRARGNVTAAARDALEQQRESPGHSAWTTREADLEVQVPASIGPAYAALQDALDLAERLAVAGRLLARPGLPEIIALRDWVSEQIQSQLRGVAPRRWQGTAQERFETAVHDRAAPDWDAAEVLAAGRPVVAADDANRIIGVSPDLAADLGWAAEDLVGRRVVTLIPPAMREAHVAGFTRHLATGEAHILDSDLTLPVLRADGTEVARRVRLEKAATRDGRIVYVAWMDPLDP